MILKNDKYLLFFIKYSLPLLVIILSLITTSFIYIENKYGFEKIKKNIENKFLEDKKHTIQEQVDSVYNYILKEQEEVENNLKASLIKRVKNTHKTVTNIYYKYKDTHSKEDILEMIKAAISDIRFNNDRGYFFITEKTGTVLVHGTFPQIEGKNLLDEGSSKNREIILESIELLKTKNEAYQEWYWEKSPKDTKRYKKIGFVKNIPELNAYIGTGEYFDDFEHDMQEEVLNQLKKFKFGKNGYIFIINKNNIYLSSQRPGIKGKSVFKQNNLKNTKLIMQKMWDKANSGGGFVKYTQKVNPITKVPTQKFSYVKVIPKWNWLIGTGFYINEVEQLINKQIELLAEKQNKDIKKILFFTLFITLFLLILSIYISNIIKNKFLEHYEALEALNESENKFRKIIEQSPYSIELYDLDGFQREVNTAHEKLWDLKAELTLNKFNILNNKDFEATGLLPYINKAYEGEIVQIPATKFDPQMIEETKEQGRKRIINTTAYPLKDTNDKVINIVIIHEDITEKEEAVKELEKRKKELEIIVQEAPNPILIHNEDGKILMINKVWENLSGYRFEEIDSIDKWINKAFKKTAKLVKKHIQTLYNINEKIDEGEFTFKTKNKETLTWHFSSAPFGIIDGKKVIITSAMDVTELKKKNMLLHQQSKMAAMGEMLGNIAHQWRQPLSTISTAATGSKIQKEMDNLSNEDFIHAMDTINDSAQYLSQTIDDFRGFFTHKEEKEEIFTITHTLNKTMKLISAQFVAKEIEIIKNIQDFELSSFENELIQVLLNILNNARDALILNEKDEKLIFINTYTKDKSAFIEIYDNADGVDEKIIDRIFEPYFTTKHQSQGTGIGLYMTQDILKNVLNATISVENKSFIFKNKKYIGANFTIEIPVYL